MQVYHVHVVRAMDEILVRTITYRCAKCAMLIECRRKQSSRRANRRRRSPQMQSLAIRHTLLRLYRRYDVEVSLGGG